MGNSEIKSIFKNEQMTINDRSTDFNRLIINIINREIKSADNKIYINKN